MPRRDVLTATGDVAALTTAVMVGEAGGYKAVVASLPPLPVVLEAAAGLLWSAARHSLTVALARPADDTDVRRAWADSRDGIAAFLVRRDLDPAELPSVMAWLGAVLADPATAWIPAHDRVLHVLAAVLVTGEMYRPYPEEWRRLLLGLAREECQ